MRNSPIGCSTRPAARPMAHAWERPWNPYRRSGHRFRHDAGRAYMAAGAGSPAWNAVSKQATSGTAGSADRVVSMAASARG